MYTPTSLHTRGKERGSERGSERMGERERQRDPGGGGERGRHSQTDISSSYPPPISMVQMENIFSESVLADTFPKPTLVRLLRAKYRDVT